MRIAWDVHLSHFNMKSADHPTPVRSSLLPAAGGVVRLKA